MGLRPREHGLNDGPWSKSLSKRTPILRATSCAKGLPEGVFALKDLRPYGTHIHDLDVITKNRPLRVGQSLPVETKRHARSRKLVQRDVRHGA